MITGIGRIGQPLSLPETNTNPVQGTKPGVVINDTGSNFSDEIVVTARRAGYTQNDPGSLYEFVSRHPWVQTGFAGAQGYSGAGGLPGKQYISPGGHKFTTAAILSPDQAAVAGQIVDIGVARGNTPFQIRLVVEQAFYESSLGSLRINPTNSDVQGLFQFDSAT